MNKKKLINTHTKGFGQPWLETWPTEHRAVQCAPKW